MSTRTLPAPLQLSMHLASEEATIALAQWLAPRLGPGDTLLLDGPIGAGKSLFARAVIQTLLAITGQSEDVPSPTFTLVQVYKAGALEIWHADLYRLAGPDDVAELGLEEAFDQALCLVEWPDRLGALAPSGALILHLIHSAADDHRDLTLTATDPRWAPVLADLAPVAV